jgi:hypothetical protein
MSNYLHFLHSNYIFKRIFLQHPEEQNMTYLEHLQHALSYGIKAFGCSLAFVVHGFVPCLFEKTGSVMLEHLNNQLNGTRLNSGSDINESDVNSDTHNKKIT